MDGISKGLFSGQRVWDKVVRGRGKTNVGAPQGFPLSLVVFLIFMAPILEAMEERVRLATNLDVELPTC